MWGVRDTQTIEKWRHGTRIALEQILSSFEKHSIKATFAPLVLFHKNKKDLLENVPIMKSYTIEKLSPYLNIENYLENEAEDPYYFGYFYSVNK
jgi:hypothetical protein